MRTSRCGPLNWWHRLTTTGKYRVMQHYQYSRSLCQSFILCNKIALASNSFAVIRVFHLLKYTLCWLPRCFFCRWLMVGMLKVHSRTTGMKPLSTSLAYSSSDTAAPLVHLTPNRSCTMDPHSTPHPIPSAAYQRRDAMGHENDNNSGN